MLFKVLVSTEFWRFSKSPYVFGYQLVTVNLRKLWCVFELHCELGVFNAERHPVSI